METIRNYIESKLNKYGDMNTILHLNDPSGEVIRRKYHKYFIIKKDDELVVHDNSPLDLDMDLEHGVYCTVQCANTRNNFLEVWAVVDYDTYLESGKMGSIKNG